MNKYILTLALIVLLAFSTVGAIVGQTQSNAMIKINEASIALQNYEQSKDMIWACSKRFNHDARLYLQTSLNYFNDGNYRKALFYAESSIVATETAKLYADTYCKCLYKPGRDGCGDLIKEPNGDDGPCGGAPLGIGPAIYVTQIPGEPGEEGCGWYPENGYYQRNDECVGKDCFELCFEGDCCTYNGCYPDPECYATDCPVNGSTPFQPGGIPPRPQTPTVTPGSQP